MWYKIWTTAAEQVPVFAVLVLLTVIAYVIVTGQTMPPVEENVIKVTVDGKEFNFEMRR